MLGHSSLKQREQYAHLYPDALRKGLDNMVPARKGLADCGVAIRKGGEVGDALKAGMAPSIGFEPMTCPLGGGRSIQLS